MTDIHETWLARQRMRWMRPDADHYTRPDAERYMRPDAARFLRPDRDRFLRPEFQECKDAPDSRHEQQSTDNFAQLDKATRTQVRLELASLRLELALLRLGVCWRKANFNPNQPRVPAGIPTGLNFAGSPQRLYPQCRTCSNLQGGLVRSLLRRR